MRKHPGWDLYGEAAVGLRWEQLVTLSVCTLSGGGEGLLYLHVSPLCVQTLDGRENLLLVPDQSHAHLA